MLNKDKQQKFSRQNRLRGQAGQTLIETLVAAFVLVMGIASAVGLAVYALNATDTSTKQIVAIGLAREGMEAVKNMRDTNWLQTPMSTDCFNFYTQTTTFPDGASCYKQWLTGSGGGTYNISPTAGGTNYRLGIDQTQTTKHWRLFSGDSNYGLNLDTTNSDYGFYIPGTIPTLSGVSVSGSNTKIGRRVRLEVGGDDPFDTADYRRLKVIVDVWWSDRRCPVSDTVPTNSACRVTLETYLTNWKNYEILSP